MNDEYYEYSVEGSGTTLSTPIMANGKRGDGNEFLRVLERLFSDLSDFSTDCID